jgi:hypothetical protein
MIADDRVMIADEWTLTTKSVVFRHYRMPGLMVIADDRTDDRWWSLMIDDDRWWSLMIADDPADDRWWSLMIAACDDHLMIALMTHDDQWWSLVIADDPDDDHWWSLMIAWSLALVLAGWLWKYVFRGKRILGNT